MMFHSRWIITAELELLTPLHIGTGEPLPDERNPLPETDDGNKPEVAALVRDAQGRPWVPPTSVKGLLRNLAERGGAGDLVATLFGEIKDQQDGRMGRLTTCGMEMIREPDSTRLPYVEEMAMLGHGATFVSAHTAIDDKTGTVDEHKLYHREMVVPGAHFRLRLALMTQDEAEEKSALQLLGRLLRTLANEDGMGFGRGRQDANGRMRLLEKSLRFLRQKLAADGELQEKMMPGVPKAFETGWQEGGLDAAGRTWRLKLTLDEFSPFFLVADPSRRETGNDDQKNRIHPLQRNDDTPHLPGESFMGALRARAEWLAQLQELRGKMSAEDAQAILDTLFGRAAKPGDTGSRGRLGLRKLEVSATGRTLLPSVALDRFSAAPVGQALFETEGFTGAVITATLHLDADAADEAREFVEKLIKDLQENGLPLGHGEAKGFGWFGVSEDV